MYSKSGEGDCDAVRIVADHRAITADGRLLETQVLNPEVFTAAKYLSAVITFLSGVAARV